MTRAAVAACAAAAALLAHAGAPVAFVADVKGSATIEGDGRLAFLTELEPGMRIFLGTGASAVLTYAASGAEFSLSGPGEFAVNASEVKADKGAVPARRDVSRISDTSTIARVSRTATASLRMRGVAAPSVERAAILEYPVDTRVATLQPVLRLRPEAGVPMTIRVRDDTGRDLWSARVTSAAMKLPMKLSPAARYTWTVATPKGIVGEADFETLTEADMAKVERSNAASRTFSQRVVHALILQDAGAEQDAREAWAALARERPDLPELARLAH